MVNKSLLTQRDELKLKIFQLNKHVKDKIDTFSLEQVNKMLDDLVDYNEQADKINAELVELLKDKNDDLKSNNDVFTALYSSSTEARGALNKAKEKLDEEEKSLTEQQKKSKMILERKIKHVAERLLRIVDNLEQDEEDEDEEPTKVQLLEMSADLDVQKKILLDFQDKVFDLDLPSSDLSSKCEDMIQEIAVFKIQIRGILMDREENDNKKKTSHFTSQSSRYKKLDSPKFNSIDTEWTTFKGLFQDFIDEENLTGKQKLQQLRECITGDALNLINLFELSDEGFDKAWNKLITRYENKRKLASIHLKTIVNLPNVTSDSAINLRKAIDPFEQALLQLEVLEPEVKKRYSLLAFYLLYQKLDKKTQEKFNETLGKEDLPQISKLIEFIEDHAQSKAMDVDSKEFSNEKKGKGGKSRVSSHLTSSSACNICSDSHFTYKCPELQKTDIDEKYKILNQKKLCSICFRPASKDHTSKTCKSKFSCTKCSGRHNVLLHREKKKDKEDEKREEEVTAHHVKVDSLISKENGSCSQVLLPTAVVDVENDGRIQPIRGLLDGGSQVNFISKRYVSLLNLKLHKSKTSLMISGLGGVNCGKTKGSVYLNLNSKYNEFSLKSVHCYVLPTITCIQPHDSVPPEKWNNLNGLLFADPKFHVPGKIDLLLGTDVTYLTQKSGKRIGGVGQLSAYETEFGWVVPGSTSSQHSPIISTHFCNLENDLQRFWEQETLPGEREIQSEGEFCENHFLQTHTRTPEGRYQVRLPFKPDSPALGDSKGQAISRFRNLERKFDKNPVLKAEYSKAINQLIELGHVEKIPAREIKKPCTESFYLPHHAVIKESSTSTKVRLVFDGSASTTTGVSLNQILPCGDTIQPELASILIRFRCYQIALCSDIKQMYHQVLVHPDDRDFLRFVWRESSDETLEEYRKRKVVFGIVIAPFLAIRSLVQNARDEGKMFPLATESILKEFYVDNLHGGKNTVKETIQLYRELDEVTKRGGFELCKWSSNSEEVLKIIPEDKREISLPLSIGENDTIKTLGIKWNPQEDYFSFNVTVPDTTQNTKRKILSHIAKLYDPEGWFGPVVINAKVIMQKLWKLNQGWDELVPSEIQKEWDKYYSDLKRIEDVRIPRKLLKPNPISVQLHGCCDASGKAYGAVVYLRSQYNGGEIVTRLVSAKSRVVPLKHPQSIPRLELMGAVLLAQLMEYVSASISEVVITDDLCYWTDSSVVLHWINSEPEKWKPFVANRVKKISTLSDVKNWHHIPTKFNPADCLSRGRSPKKLQEFNSWWSPEFLNQSIITYGEIPGSSTSLKVIEEETKKKKEDTSSLLVIQSVWLFDRFSSWNRMKRVVSFILRFCKRGKELKLISDELSVGEIEQAEKTLIKVAQSQTFEKEIRLLKNKEQLTKSSKLHKLYPFVDQDGILRVTGRLNNALVTESEKHPAILCGNHPISKLIIRACHLELAHGGSQLIRSVLTEKYWILQAKRITSNVIHNCAVCHRIKLKAANQLMGQLPPCRVQPSPTFHSTGVDFAGPFKIKSGILPASRGKAASLVEVFVAVFVCMVTKAVHLEPVLSLSTPAFLDTFWKFIGRRGRPAHVYSDNGKNFIGAASELKEIQKFLENKESRKEIIDQLALKKITWHFIPPRAPHHGGLWEAGVKSMKYHLKRIIKDQILTYTELETILVQVEGILNSRPLCPMSTDPENCDALTPGHFLIGRSLVSPPQIDLLDVSENRLSKWEKIQFITQHLWKKWSKDYLSSLQQRPKWWSQQNNFQVGQLVILMEDNSSPWEWKLARVLEVHPGVDGKVRVVTVKTNKKDEKGRSKIRIYKRPIAKIAQLPLEQEVETQPDNEAEAARSISDNDEDNE